MLQFFGQKKNIIRIFTAISSKFGFQEILGIQIFYRDPIKNMFDGSFLNFREFGESGRRQMELHNSARSLKCLYEPLAGRNIKRLHFHIEDTVQCLVDLLKVLFVAGWNKYIPIKSKTRHSLLKHCLAANDDIFNPCLIQQLQDFFHSIPP